MWEEHECRNGLLFDLSVFSCVIHLQTLPQSASFNKWTLQKLSLRVICQSLLTADTVLA